ncbi:MAG: solute carrier family 23 protein [Methanoregula sp.]
MEGSSIPKPSYELTYSVEDVPPPATCALLGIQHALLIATSFIFPMILFKATGMGSSDAAFFLSMTILVVGIGTILQSLKGRYIGSGYLCPSFAALFFIPPSIRAFTLGGYGLLCGMTAVSGVFQVALSRIVHRLRVLFPPEVTGLVIVMAGVGGIPFAIESCIGLRNPAGVADLPSVTIAAVTLLVIIATSVWGKGGVKLFTAIIGIIAGYITAFLLGQLPATLLFSLIALPLFTLPRPVILGWSFDAVLLLPFLIAGLAGTLKTIGNVTTCQKIHDAKWTRPDMQNCGRGIFTDGLTNILSGVFGGLGQSTSSGNIGLSLASAATSRRIGIVAGALLILMAFFPHASFFFMVMPVPVMGAILVYAICYMVMLGIEIMMSRMMDTRKFFIIGISFTFGLGASTLAAVPFAAEHTWLATLLTSPLTLSTLMAIGLTLLFRIGIQQWDEITLIPATKDLADTVFTFVDRNGRRWGARRDVMHRAGSALFECIEDGFSTGSMKNGAKVKMSFDEYHLDIYVESRGPPVTSTTTVPTPEELMNDPEAFSRLSSAMVYSYADGVTVSHRDGMNTTHIHFEH